jgi:glycerol-3-phosphate dehydrogenase (NAD(P)+)
MTVLILGAGEIGTCLGRILEKHHTILYWDKDVSRRQPNQPLSQIVPRAETVLVCVPSLALRQVLEEIKPWLKQSALIICLSKGLETTGKLTPEIIKETVPHNQFLLLAGPMIAEELNLGLAGYAVAAGDKTAYEVAQNIFAKTNINLEYSPDTRSVALCSSLKNIYALFMGMADPFDKLRPSDLGLGLEEVWGERGRTIDSLKLALNSKGYIISRILKEWTGLCRGLEIDPIIVWGTAGLADFLTTSLSQHSYNRAAGQKIIQGEKTESEGTRSLIGIIKILEKQNLEIPALLKALNTVIYQGAQPKQIISKALNL